MQKRRRKESTRARPRHPESLPDKQLAPMIVALAKKIRGGKITVDALNNIARYFTYDRSFTDTTDRNVLGAIGDLNAACIYAYGHAQEQMILRFRKGTVRSDDLKQLFRLTALQ